MAPRRPRTYIKVMEFRPTALERAFTLANSGTCFGVEDIRRRLRAEGYPHQSLEGPMLIRQLRKLCLASSGDRPA